MEELFQQVWAMLLGKDEGKGSEEAERMLDRIAHISSVKEPDYEQVWKQIRQRTIERHRGRKLLLLRTAAVFVPALVILAAVYLFHVKSSGFTSDQTLVKRERLNEPFADIRLTLADGKVIHLQKDSLGEVLRTKQMAIRQQFPATISYEVNETKGTELVYHTLEIPDEADYRLTLSDGTVVYLNSSSKLKYPVTFVGKERRVYLEGEGYFEVKSDPEHPFRVETGGVVVEAVGTAFNINAYPEKGGIEATLVKGKVHVTASGQQVVLLPGQQARCGEEHIEVYNVDCREFISWKEGMFIFNRMPLEHIMMQMQRWYGLTVFFRSEGVKKYTFTGMIDKHMPAAETFRVIEKTVKVHFSLKGKTVVIE